MSRLDSPDSGTPSPLPDFSDPPVIETVLGVSFLEVPALTSVNIVQFWGEHLRSELPSSLEAVPL